MRQLVQSLKDSHRLILALLADLLFIGNYEICELFYRYDVYKWWGLKQNIYNVIIAMVFILANSKRDNEDKKVSFLINVGVGFCISNCIDRLFFDINHFTKADVYMITATLITSYVKVYIENVKIFIAWLGVKLNPLYLFCKSKISPIYMAIKNKVKELYKRIKVWAQQT